MRLLWETGSHANVPGLSPHCAPDMCAALAAGAFAWLEKY